MNYAALVVSGLGFVLALIFWVVLVFPGDPGRWDRAVVLILSLGGASALFAILGFALAYFSPARREGKQSPDVVFALAGVTLVMLLASAVWAAIVPFLRQ